MSSKEQTAGPTEDVDGKSAAPASQHVVDVKTSGVRVRPPRVLQFGGDPLGVLTRLGGGAVPVEVFCPQSVAPRHPNRMRAVSPLSRNSKHTGAHSGAVVTAAWLPGGPASIRSDTGP